MSAPRHGTLRRPYGEDWHEAEPGDPTWSTLALLATEYYDEEAEAWLPYPPGGEVPDLEAAPAPAAECLAAARAAEAAAAALDTLSRALSAIGTPEAQGHAEEARGAADQAACWAAALREAATPAPGSTAAKG